MGEGGGGAAGALLRAPQAPLFRIDAFVLTLSVCLLMLILKTNFQRLNRLWSRVSGSYDLLLKLLWVYRSYPIDMPISNARLPTAEAGLTGARALVLVGLSARSGSREYDIGYVQSAKCWQPLGLNIGVPMLKWLLSLCRTKLR